MMRSCHAHAIGPAARSQPFSQPVFDVPLVPWPAFAFNAAMQDLPPMAAEAAPSLDDLLLAVGRQRDRAAFAALFTQVAPRLKAYLRRQGSDAQQAEELVQDAMLLVWRRAELFDPARASAATWIFTIARNRRLDLRRREARPEFDAQDPALVPDPVEPADHRLEATQSAGRLRAALKDLPPEQAELLHLAYFEDKAHSTISTERGIPLGTVKSRLRLALDRLRKVLREPS